MKNDVSLAIYKKLLWTAFALIIVVLVGTIGYSILGNEDYTFLDCLFMTVITISTIGYREIIDLSGNTPGRIFTMFLAFSGIAILTYVFSSITAFAVEGILKKTFRRKRMEKKIKKLNDHFIICGIKKVGFNIVREFSTTNRPLIIINNNQSDLEKVLELFPDQLYIEGDATDDNVLLKAGIQKAKGLFATMEDDHENLVISLSAKQLNSELNVIASANEVENIDKILKAGANNVISPTFIGGLRIASEMIRPAAVSFLDIMLRDKDRNLRVEDILIPKKLAGKKISSLNFEKYKNTLLLAVKTQKDKDLLHWNYIPQATYELKEDDILIVMTNPTEREKIQKSLWRKL